MPRLRPALAFVALVLALAAALSPAARAQTLLTFDPPDLTIDYSNHPRAYLDFHTGALSYAAPSHYDLQLFFIDRFSLQAVGWFNPATYYETFTAVIANNNAYADKFTAGSTVFSNHQFVYTAPINSSGINNATWPAGSTGYLGVALTTDLTNFNYGWIHASYNADLTFTIQDFGFNTLANQAATIAAVPEPPAWTLLVLGLVFAAFGSALHRPRLPARVT